MANIDILNSYNPILNSPSLPPNPITSYRVGGGINTVIPNPEPIVIPTIGQNAIIQLKRHNPNDSFNLIVTQNVNGTGTQLNVSNWVLSRPDHHPYIIQLTVDDSVRNTYGGQTFYAFYDTTGTFIDDVILQAEVEMIIDHNARVVSLESTVVTLSNQISLLQSSGGITLSESFTPINNAIGITINVAPKIDFNKAPDDAYVNYISYYLTTTDRTNNTNAIVGTLSRPNSKEVLFTTSTNISYAQPIYGRIKSGLGFVDGTTVTSPIDWQFTIMPVGQVNNSNVTAIGSTNSITITLSTAHNSDTTLTYDVAYNGQLEGNIIATNQTYTAIHAGLLIAGTYTNGLPIYVRARQGSTLGDWSLATSAVITLNQPPSVPTGLVSSVLTSTGFHLAWTASTDPENNTPITYKIYKGGVLYASSISTAYTDITGQTPSIATWTVSAVDSLSNESAQSTGLSVTIPTNSAPTLSVAVTGTTTIGSTLTATTTVGTDPDGDTVSTTTWRWLRNAVAISGATANTHVIVEADLGTTLTAEATVTMSAGTNPSPTVNSGTAIPVPAPPTLTLVVGNGKVTNTFTPNTTLSTETYNAYYTTDGTTPTSPVSGTTVKLTGVTSPFDVTATNGLTVKVALEMVDNGVASALSAVVSGVPTAVITYPHTYVDGATLPLTNGNMVYAVSGGATLVENPAGTFQFAAVSTSDVEYNALHSESALPNGTAYSTEIEIDTITEIGKYAPVLCIFDNTATPAKTDTTTEYAARRKIFILPVKLTASTYMINIYRVNSSGTTEQYSGSVWGTSADIAVTLPLRLKISRDASNNYTISAKTADNVTTYANATFAGSQLRNGASSDYAIVGDFSATANEGNLSWQGKIISAK